MTDYSGEAVTIIIDRMKSALGVALTDLNVESVSVIITDADGVVVQAEDDATWDASIAGWTYDWDASSAEPGLYVAEAHINSQTPGPPGLEFLTFHLSRSPIPVPV